MTSRTTERFRRLFARLPSEGQEHARRAFSLWRRTPSHSSLQFKRIHTRDPIYSVRIGVHWRALAAVRDHRVVWFWIRPHSEYDTLMSQL
jgi:hypothetical protein